MSDECRLDKQRAGAAHGVDEVTLALPAGHKDDAGCQHLIDGSIGLCHTPATLVEWLTRRVERQRGAVLGNVDVEPQVGIAHRDVWPLARALA